MRLRRNFSLSIFAFPQMRYPVAAGRISSPNLCISQPYLTVELVTSLLKCESGQGKVTANQRPLNQLVQQVLENPITHRCDIWAGQNASRPHLVVDYTCSTGFSAGPYDGKNSSTARSPRSRARFAGF